MLIQMGVDMNMADEIGKRDIQNMDVSMWLLISYTSAPIHTMTDSAVVERCGDLKSAALTDVGLLCNMTSQDLVEEHQSSYKLTILHKTLLGLNPENSSLRGYLQSLQRLGSLAELIDKPESRGRSALAWAVEYGMADAVRTLLSFGANAYQYRRSSQSQFPLLHLVIAGSPPPLKSGFLEVMKILLGIHV
jgi:ankyrin repeat protein